MEVKRTPAPGAARGTWRTFRETLRGLMTTFGRFREGPVTIQYPEEKTAVYPRFRGRHKLHRFEDTGLEKCVGCSLCAAACPADCIRVVAAENTPEHRVSAGERYAAVYEINLSRCIFCGYCEVACPFDAITMGHDYELSDYDRTDLIFTKEMLLAEPLERTPLRNDGRVSAWPRRAVSASCSSSPRFGAIAGAIGVVMLRDPFFAVLALVGHLLSLAVLFLLLRAEFVAAVQVVVYAGAVMVLYVFVVAYVGGREEPDRRAAARARPGGRAAASRRGDPQRRAARRAADRAARHGPEGGQRRRRPLRPGGGWGPNQFGTPAYIGQLLLTRFLLVFEAASFLLTIAAVGAVVLARRRGGITEDEVGVERRLTPLDLIRPRDTGTMVEGVGGPSYAAAQARAEHGEPDAERGEGDVERGESDASNGEPAVAAAGTSEQEGGW